MRRLNKKGIELSINFIVMMILGMAMFFGGMVFVTKFFSQAADIKGSMDSQTERQIEAMLDSGSAFVIPIHTKEINRKNFDTFGIGVYNDGSGDPLLNTFKLKVVFSSAFATRTKLPLCSSSSCDADEVPEIKPGVEQSADIPVGTKHKFLVLAEIPSKTQSGTYIYTVSIDKGVAEYQPSLQLIVKVP